MSVASRAWIRGCLGAAALIQCVVGGRVIVRAQPQTSVLFERERSAVRYGGVVPGAAIELAPLAKGPGRVFFQPFWYSGTTRLHFAISTPPLDGDWELRITDGGTVVWKTTAAEEAGLSFWSEEVPAGNLAIEVRTTQESTGFQVTVDKVAVASGVQAVPQSTTPPDCKTPIESMTPPPGCKPVDAGVAARVRSWAPSIARLRLVAADDSQYYCTAFLIARDLLLTNWHCVQSVQEMIDTRVDFDFDVAGGKPMTLRLKEWIAPSQSPFDFVVLRLKTDPHRAPLHLADQPPGNQLVVIQHPNGLPKHVSIEDCKVTSPSIPGVDRTKLTDFGHFCDTFGGSSGSPVQDALTGDVFGLHHLGFRKGSNQSYNQAISIGQILAEIDVQRHDIRLEIK